ncbi:MAG: amidohydrolase family protein [Acetobacteraceae bacterium]|nr:amidohydrolase family protein [Acetobacteraceae bacterium]
MSMLVVTADRVIDGTGREPIEGGAVLIENGRIAAVGRRADLAAPAGAAVIDRQGETLLPGLVDAHSHVSIIPGLGNQGGQLRERAGKAMLRAVPNLRADLLSGVTTMRVMGEEHFLDVDLKAAIEAGRVPGPRLVIATRMIAARHGHGTALTASDGAEEIRRHIRENLAAGADFIKFFATGGTSSARAAADTCFYSEEEIRLIIGEAHRDGRPAAVHAHGGPAVKLCVEAGVDTIEHGKLCTAEDFALMRKHNTWLVTNNAISFHPDGIEKGDAHTPEIMAKLNRGRANVPKMFRLLLDSGVRWALGTDSMHGLLWYEAQKAVEFGASTAQALAGVTRNAADAIGRLGEIGTLQPGKRGDVVSVRGNPLADIAVLREVGLILKDGVRMDTLTAA